jgi:hypothetical protein
MDRPSGKQPKDDNELKGFWNCGSETHHSRLLCPANGMECGKCTKIGHFARVCSFKKSTKPPQTGCITLDPNFSARVAGIEESDLVKAEIQPNGSKKEIIIQI